MFFGLWVPHVIGARGEVVVSLDWMSFATDGHEVVALSMATRHGRSTPPLWRTVDASELKGRGKRPRGRPAEAAAERWFPTM